MEADTLACIPVDITEVNNKNWRRLGAGNTFLHIHYMIIFKLIKLIKNILKVLLSQPKDYKELNLNERRNMSAP